MSVSLLEVKHMRQKEKDSKPFEHAACKVFKNLFAIFKQGKVKLMEQDTGRVIAAPIHCRKQRITETHDVQIRVPRLLPSWLSGIHVGFIVKACLPCHNSSSESLRSCSCGAGTNWEAAADLGKVTGHATGCCFLLVVFYPPPTLPGTRSLDGVEKDRRVQVSCIARI